MPLPPPTAALPFNYSSGRSKYGRDLQEIKRLKLYIMLDGASPSGYTTTLSAAIITSTAVSTTIFTTATTTGLLILSICKLQFIKRRGFAWLKIILDTALWEDRGTSNLKGNRAESLIFFFHPPTTGTPDTSTILSHTQSLSQSDSAPTVRS